MAGRSGRIALEASVVENLVGFVDLEADAWLAVDVAAKGPPRAGGMNEHLIVHADIELRHAIGISVFADRGETAAKAALQKL